jgi:hypothetical protein
VQLTQDQIEVVDQVLTEERSAAAIADRLFSPSGLFSQWAATADERRQLALTPIFRKAQARFRTLQFEEAKAFSKAVASVHAAAKAPTAFKWDGITSIEPKKP